MFVLKWLDWVGVQSLLSSENVGLKLGLGITQEMPSAKYSNRKENLGNPWKIFVSFKRACPKKK